MRRCIPLFGIVLLGCGHGADDPGDPAPGFGRVQAIIAKKDRNDPIPRLKLATKGPVRADKTVHTKEEWRAILPQERFEILREQGTERPNSSPLLKVEAPGVFRCAACGLPLFETAAKYDSGTGWPSFVRPLDASALWYKLDRTGGLHRVEVLCARCDGHLGHVFDDGPPARGGLRYCMDGAAMTFKAAARPAR